MYSFPSVEPVHSFTLGSNCCFLTCIQISQEDGKVVWYSHLFKNFAQFVVIHTVKGFSSQWSRCFSGILLLFLWSTGVGNLISGSSAISKSNLNIWKFLVHILLKPSLENFEHEHYFARDECNCAVVWTFFGIVFLWVWNENWPFPVLWPLLSFPNLLAYWEPAVSQHHLLGFEIAQLEFHHLHLWLQRI